MERFDGSARSDSELGLRLREALEPCPETVERIVRGALAPERPKERFRLAPALTVVAALVLAAGLLVLAPYPPRPEPGRQAKISIENVGGLLVVHHRERGRWIIRGSRSGGPAEGSLPSRSLIVIYGGKP